MHIQGGVQIYAVFNNNQNIRSGLYRYFLPPGIFGVLMEICAC
jgi:hypothetical protein